MVKENLYFVKRQQQTIKFNLQRGVKHGFSSPFEDNLFRFEKHLHHLSEMNGI
jgi:hypothetical protein